MRDLLTVSVSWPLDNANTKGKRAFGGRLGRRVMRQRANAQAENQRTYWKTLTYMGLPSTENNGLWTLSIRERPLCWVPWRSRYIF